MRVWLTAASVGVLVACGASGGADAPEIETAGETAAAGEEGDTGEHEPPGACGEAPACELEDVCSVTACGGKAASISHFGCPRVSCETDAGCADTEACYPRVLGGACLASSVSCEVGDDGCTCAETADCAGTLGAHCIPREFYPVEEYCDLGPFECEDLPPWQEAMRAARAHHVGAGGDELAERVAACSETVVDARLSCGESVCQIACALSGCGAVETDCVAACEAAAFDADALTSLNRALAVAAPGTCACDLCAEGMNCASVWSC